MTSTGQGLTLEAQGPSHLLRTLHDHFPKAKSQPNSTLYLLPTALPPHLSAQHPPLKPNNPTMSPPPPSHTSLLNAATSFCAAFASHTPPIQLLQTHFTHHHPSIRIHEHGLPQLAPFLGRTFTGAAGLAEYLSLVSSSLTYSDLHFTSYLVDAAARQVCVRGGGRFTWTSTGQSWDETFVYILGFDEEGRVERYEVWADTGAAWLAGRGEL